MRMMLTLASTVIVISTVGAAWFWTQANRATGQDREKDLVRPAAPWLDHISSETLAERPNVILVVYDARRREDFSFGPFGNKRGDTPFLAEFSRNAVYFQDAVAPGCWTVPTHASIFSGLSVADLDIDYYHKGWSSFPTEFLSLAEVLQLAGYKTIAYADHPFFFSHYHKKITQSLIRGFELFSVISDQERYGSYTNVGTADGGIEHRHDLTGMEEMSFNEMEQLITQFNEGRLRFDLAREADYDEEHGLYLARLKDLFDESRFFDKRYEREFDRFVFDDRDDRPFFFFANLHLCFKGKPDPRLWSRWFLKSVMLNAQALGKKLTTQRRGSWVADEDEIYFCIKRNYRRLGLPERLVQVPVPVESPTTPLKHIFDNRFFDASFEALWEYFSRRGLTDNTVTIVCSDHGMGQGEHGERFYCHAGARPTEGLTRVPLVVRFPATSDLAIFNGTETRMVSLVDIFQTVVDFGVGPGVFKRKIPVRGKSLAHRLRSDDFEETLYADSMLRPELYDHLPGLGGESRAIYRDHMKLIYAPKLYELPKGWWLARPPEEEYRVPESLILLYDLVTDPQERRNLADEMPEVTGELLQLYAGIADYDIREAEPVAPKWDRDALATLKSLGYVD